jgi:hypothetical protein
MSIHVTPIPQTLELTTPAFTLGTSNVAGSALTSVASNSTLAVFDSTIPTSDTYADFFGSSSTTGAAAIAARRDHNHGTTNNFAVNRLFGH